MKVYAKIKAHDLIMWFKEDITKIRKKMYYIEKSKDLSEKNNKEYDFGKEFLKITNPYLKRLKFKDRN